MLRDKILFLMVFLLTLNSCSFLRDIFGTSREVGHDLPDPNNESENLDLTTEQLKFIERQCISDPFRERDKNNLYGKECLEGRSLVIETLKEGANIISTSAVTGTGEDGGPAVKLEGPPDFINQVYRASYKILQQEGDAEHYSFLTDRFFPLGKDFNASFKEGSQRTRYHIIFKVEGNYLVLYKASRDLRDIPYIERSSMPFDRKVGKYQPDENGFYKVPFLGWPIEHCTTDYAYTDTGEQLSVTIPLCDSSNKAKSGKYIKIKSSVPELYSYQLKKDLFPTNYFDGEWFFSSGRIEGPASIEDTIAPTEAYFVTLHKQKNSLKAIDQSGNIISQSDRRILTASSLPVKWVEYEPDKIGPKVFKSFGEKLKENREDEINTNLMLFDFDNFYIENEDGNREKAEVVELFLSDNYFSFVAKANWTPVNFEGEKIRDDKDNLINYLVRYRFSLLRADFLDQQGFTPKKMFLEDDNHIFGSLFVAPQDIRKLGDISVSDSIAHIRNIRFNTSLNTEEEKKSKTKVIKWYFSKNSVKDPKYRNIAQRAIEIYNRAFEIITKRSNQKIKVELVGNIEDDKELGDMRYNIINLVQTDQVGWSGNLFGIAPSYVHFNTGQIIGTTSNVMIHALEDSYILKVWQYVRHEIFRKDVQKGLNETFKTHLVTPYFADRIETEPDCKPVMDFIKETKKQKNLSPDTELNDKEIRVKCGKKLAEKWILFILLHELGHNFGLGHNFKGSVDEDNYYKTIEEIQALFPKVPQNIPIAKSSTVMEYLQPAAVPPMVYLGKYDLAALRYIYMNQVEEKSSSDEGDVKFLTLDIHQDPDQQKPLPDSIKSRMKSYQHCSTYVALVTRLNEDFHCIPFDYGSTPIETVQFYIDRFKRAFNILRYRYDADKRREEFLYVSEHAGLIKHIIAFYREWLKLRNNYLSVSPSNLLIYNVSDPNSIYRYTNIINNGLEELKDSSYALYYPVRELVSNFLMDFLFLESMQCLIRHRHLNIERSINLNLVIRNLVPFSGPNGLYAKDCYSPEIRTFFESQKYELIGQKGFEDFITYKNFFSSNQANDNWDISPIGEILIQSIILGKTHYDNVTIPEITRYLGFNNEPDLLHKFRVRLEKNLLEDKNGFSEMEFAASGLLYANLFQILLEIRMNEGSIGQKNINYFLSRKFDYGKGSNSFSRLVENPLIRGNSIESTAEKVPFLSFAYYQYRDHLGKYEMNELLTDDEIVNFRKWMCAPNLDKVLCNEEEGFIIVPFHPQNFSAKLIKKYNDLKARVRELKLKGNLTAMDRIDIYHLEQRINFIDQVSLSIGRQENEENPL